MYEFKNISQNTHKTMKKLKSNDTSIETVLRKELWRRGYRFRKNDMSLPGKPDIVLTKYKIAIFCDGEFFHGKDWNARKLKLAQGNNGDYWVKKYQEIGKETMRSIRNFRLWDGPSFDFGDMILKKIQMSVSRLLKKLFSI